MKRVGEGLVAALAGALFAAGLAVSGMTDPAKVKGFLDVTGDWDASLAFVMASALAVYAVGHRLVLRRPAPLFDGTFHLPTRKDVDGKLVVGAALFGVGWGLSGVCPGPGLASLTAGPAGWAFVAAMALGMVVENLRSVAKVPAPTSDREGGLP